MNIAIYQIDPDRDENNVAFLNYENLERFQGSAALRSEIYDKVFEGKVDCGTLEEVYQMFNLDHPDEYRGRSLSVSDVVEVVGEEKSTFHFCDSIGFREVDFDPDMTEPLKEKKIKVVLCEPGKVARVAEIGTELSDLQRVVGGLIEPYREYKAAGMSEENIQAIYAFDLNAFRKNRTECKRTQPLSESSCDDGIEQGESMSALLKKFSSALSACDKYSFQADPRFAWIDEMENDELYRKIISLPERDLDLLTLIAFEGYSQREVAEIRGIAPAAICKKIAKLKKLLYGG